MYLLCDITSISRGNALGPNKHNSVPCAVKRTFRQRSCNERVGCLQWLGSTALDLLNGLAQVVLLSFFFRYWLGLPLPSQMDGLRVRVISYVKIPLANLHLEYNILALSLAFCTTMTYFSLSFSTFIGRKRPCFYLNDNHLLRFLKI